AVVLETIFAIATDVRMKEPEQVVVKTPTPPSEPAGPIQRADVAKVYNENCASCHGVDGSGKQIRAGMPTIPDFTSLAWQLSQTDLEIAHRILDGNEPLMPAYRDYTRGLALTREAAFVGLSRIRETSTFGGVPIAEKRDQLKCGVGIVELRTGNLAAL